MLQIALLLMGANFVRQATPLLALFGVLWGIAGLSIFIDGLDGMLYFPSRFFSGLLICESLVMLIMAPGAAGARKPILYFEGTLFLFIALMTLLGHGISNLLLALLFGFAFFITGLFVMASAWVVRFDNWKASFVAGIGYLAFALFLFQPYPTHHKGTIAQLVGMLMLISGIQCVRTAWRAFRLHDRRSVFALLAPERLFIKSKASVLPDDEQPDTAPAGENGPLTVHVWTPEGSAAHQPIPRPVFNRYIAAVDATGVISTGHAALELPPALYISLYPAVDIDRSPSEFFNTLKAIQENNVAGKFQPDYSSESAAWCESDRKIIFHNINGASLKRYWLRYRDEEIYNLTSRNCSSSVAYGLEAALDGVFAQRYGWLRFLGLFFIPEMWIAAQLRKRATTMAWTPGLVLDYARALSAIVHPADNRWFSIRRQTERLN
ncbi:MFS transporter [Shimwellia pseudoproteus]|uniref:MFS transporter n=1 Tax=Shimwellia pseudoproteus TaxID=570012 RepID=UPI0018ED21DE|nr:MFS transporter [Shimwellia pseudoproteus]MBJ3814944.1 MFS transporter [Shimwellia pseudoproteus]